jgi:hypothetical protein
VRTSSFVSWLTPLVLVVGLGSAVMLVASQYMRPGRISRAATVGLLTGGLAAGLAGQAAYAFDTAATPHTGAIPSAGPGTTGGFGRGGLFAGGPGNGRFGGQNPRGQAPGGQGSGGQVGGRVQGGGRRNGGVNPFGGGSGGFGGQSGNGPQAGGPGGAGGLLNAGTPGSDLLAALTANADKYTWVAATVGANNAAGYQLATQRAVMPIGGFNGSDPTPTVQQFQAYVAAGRIHYFIGGGGLRASGGSNDPAQISQWVSQNFTASTIDGVVVYDLSGAARPST